MPRIAHPSPDSPARAALLGWIAGTVSDDEARRALPTVDRFLTAQAVTSARQAVRVVCEQRVPWEFPRTRYCARRPCGMPWRTRSA